MEINGRERRKKERVFSQFRKITKEIFNIIDLYQFSTNSLNELLSTYTIYLYFYCKEYKKWKPSCRCT